MRSVVQYSAVYIFYSHCMQDFREFPFQLMIFESHACLVSERAIRLREIGLSLDVLFAMSCHTVPQDTTIFVVRDICL